MFKSYKRALGLILNSIANSKLGAIPEGIEQEIFFKVCHDMNMLPPLDQDKGNSAAINYDLFWNLIIGETLLSPVVMCGPAGLKFLQSVELRLPHCAALNPDTWSFALKSSDTANGK